jgi:hypothetical protein
MRLHLGSILALDDDVGVAKALIDIASRTAGAGPAQIALLRQAFGRATAARGRLLFGRARKDRRCVLFHRGFELGDMRQAFVFDAYQFRRSFRGSRSCRRNRSQRLSCEAHEGIRFSGFVPGIAQLRGHQ